MEQDEITVEIINDFKRVIQFYYLCEDGRLNTSRLCIFNASSMKSIEDFIPEIEKSIERWGHNTCLVKRWDLYKVMDKSMILEMREFVDFYEMVCPR